MTACWILYDRKDLEVNSWFAERLRDSGNELGLECSIVTTDSVDYDNVPDVVVSRCRDSNLTSLLEDLGATVYNRSSVSRICNDKAMTYQFAESLNIPYLPYALPGSKLPPGPPWVVKSCIGHGGTEVFLAESRKEVEVMLGYLEDRKPMVQTMADIRGRDLRVYVLGGKIIASVMRSCLTDFRANFSLGGNAELYEPPQSALNIVGKILPELLPDFVGIDFVFGRDGVYLNEIEDVVGTRMLYELTPKDPARMYMEYIAQSKTS